MINLNLPALVLVKCANPSCKSAAHHPRLIMRMSRVVGARAAAPCKCCKAWTEASVEADGSITRDYQLSAA